MQCIIIKNPNAKKLKYFGATDWTENKAEAVLFEGSVDALRVIKAITCKTATWVSA